MQKILYKNELTPVDKYMILLLYLFIFIWADLRIKKYTATLLSLLL